MGTRAFSMMAGLFLLANLAQGQERIVLSEQAADLTVISPEEVFKFGSSLSCGDVNGDELEDLVVGAPSYNEVGEPLGGRVYLIYGRSSFPDTLDWPEGMSVIIAPDSVDLGWAVACGDVNTDGIDDILIGAPWSSPLGRREAGAVYIIYGKTTGLPEVWNLNISPADELIVGREEGDALGVSLALGDVNNDGLQDLTLGAFTARRPDSTRYLAGSVFLLLNTKNPPVIEDLASASRPVVQMVGEWPNDYCGWAVACGDVNGDPLADVLIGAHKANPHLPDEGKAYLISGRPTFAGVVTINMDTADVQFQGGQFQEHLAYSLAIGDFNGDKLGDVVLGSRQGSPEEVIRAGRMRVVFGNSALPESIDFKSSSPDLDVYGEVSGSMLGTALAVGDVNGDGFDDLLAGAPFSEFNLPTPPGRAYLFLGDPNFSGVWDLKIRPAALSIVGADSSDHLGASLACGDLNGDGYDDIIVAAPGGKSGGAIYVIFGRKTTHIIDPQ
ncbi:MAG: FG-GAP-like repeat-containing protein, partial [candidate division KSB1 bacterium]|nr:FG-GAP-like repeat-containing protein [candidate division KSB1 bacterium]